MMSKRQEEKRLKSCMHTVVYMIMFLIYHNVHINQFNLKALCESLEDTVYRLRKDLVEKNSEIDLLHDELALYKRQVEMLTTALRYSAMAMQP